MVLQKNPCLQKNLKWTEKTKWQNPQTTTETKKSNMTTHANRQGDKMEVIKAMNSSTRKHANRQRWHFGSFWDAIEKLTHNSKTTT